MPSLADLDFDDIPAKQSKPITLPESSAKVIEETSPERRVTRRTTAEIQQSFTAQSSLPKPGDCLYLDIETVPDESRMHLFPLEPMPPTRLIENMMPADDFAQFTEEKAKQYLDSVSPVDEWFDGAISAEESREKGPRKGVLSLLRTKRSVQEDRIKEMSVNPMFCRIVAIGLKVGSQPVESMLCSMQTDEYTALVEAWRIIQKHRPVIGFNVRDFDLRVMLVRSAILGVEPAYVPDTRKYGSPDVIDLMQAIYGDRCPKGCGMKPTAKMFGIDVPEDHGDGSQVYKLYQSRDWKRIADYLVGDVELTAAVHQKIAGTLCQ